MLLRVLVEDLRIRAEPDTASDVVAIVSTGTFLQATGTVVMADAHEWHEVRVGTNVSGWVANAADGTWLAEVTNGRIGFSMLDREAGGELVAVTVNPDGSDLQVVLGGSAHAMAWSPDGAHLVISNGTDNGQYPTVLLTADGSHVADLGVSNGQATWALDGSGIALVRYSEGVDDPHVIVFDGNGANARDLGPGDRPVWSPDGRLAFIDAMAGTLLVVDGDQAPARFTVSRNGAPRDMAWSPDGGRLAFTAINCPQCAAGPVAGEPPMALFVMSPPEGQPEIVADGGWGEGIWWAPDGSGISYGEFDFSGERGPEVRWVDLASGQMTVLAAGADIGYGDAFSPDGTRMAMAGTTGIVVSNIDGTDAVVVAPSTEGTNPMPQRPRWSPDGEWILYDSVWITGDAIDPWVVRADGSDARQLATVGYDATWQPVLRPLTNGE